jgi:hypothetical protein
MVKTGFCLLLVLFLSSCEKEVNIPFPFDGKKPVVFAVLKVGQPVRLEIDVSYDLNSEISFEKNDELYTIILFENNVTVDTLKSKTRNLYLGDYLAKLNSSYYLKIETIKFGTVLSEKIMPVSIITNTNIILNKDKKGLLNSSKKAIELDITISDSNPKDFYYILNIQAYLKNEIKFVAKTPIGINSEVSDKCSSFLSDYTYIKNGNCLINTKDNIKYNVELSVYDRELGKSREPDSILVSIQKVDKNFKDFLLSYDDSNFLENAFKTTTLFKSNFDNAIGMFYPVFEQRKTFIYKKDY